MPNLQKTIEPSAPLCRSLVSSRSKWKQSIQGTELLIWNTIHALAKMYVYTQDDLISEAGVLFCNTLSREPSKKDVKVY